MAEIIRQTHYTVIHCQEPLNRNSVARYLKTKLKTIQLLETLMRANILFRQLDVCGRSIVYDASM